MTPQWPTYQTAGWTVVELTGDLDLATAPTFRHQVIGLLTSGHPRVLLDLSALGHLDSVGLGMIVAVRKRARALDARLEVVCPDPRLRRTFAVADLDRIIDLHPSVAAALGIAPSAGTSVEVDE